MSNFSSIPWNVHLKIIWTSAGLAAVGVPGAFAAHADVAVIATAWVGLSVYLASACRQNIDRDTLTKVVAGVITAVSLFMLGYKAATTAGAYTVVGTLPAIVANAGLNGIITYAYGRALYTVLNEDDGPRNADRMIDRIRELIVGWFSFK